MLMNTNFIAAVKGMTLVVGLISGAGTAHAQEDPIKNLYALVAHLKSENAELAELVTYHIELRALLNVDPTAAIAARRPYSECLNSVLVEYCPAFGAMYQTKIEDVAVDAK
jgi:hypothetical protein